MKNELAPIIRILLFSIAARLTAGGWLPPQAASIITTDPVFVELGVAALLWLGTFWAYLRSQARKALNYLGERF